MPTQPLVIELWTDIICPWCGLGKHRLDKALSDFEHRDSVKVIHRSFQLDERHPMGATQPVRQMLRAKKGMSDAQITSITSQIEAMAKAEGLAPYRVGENLVGNTSLAHELAHWAQSQPNGEQIWEKLYKAYFGEMRSIFDVKSLATIAEECGLDSEKATQVLTERQFAQQVLKDGQEARKLGCSGVPFFLINKQWAIGGAQSSEVLLKAIRAAWAHHQTAFATQSASCSADGCTTELLINI